MPQASPVRPRFDVSYPRDYIDPGGKAQTRWHPIGAAFLGDVGISVVLHAVPTAVHEGQTRFNLFPARGEGEASTLPDGLPGRFEVASYRTYPSDDGERTVKARVGIAFTHEDHITVLLDSIPASRVEGAIRLFLREATSAAAGSDDTEETEASAAAG